MVPPRPLVHRRSRRHTGLKTRFGGLSYLLGLAFALKTMPMSIVPILSASGNHGPFWSFVFLVLLKNEK